MKRLLWLALVVSAATLLPAQTSSTPAAKPKKPAAKTTVSAAEVNSLRDALAAQQNQMEQQRQQMEQLKSQLSQLLESNQQAVAAAQKVQGNAQQAETVATQAQQSATEAQRLADQASANAVEAKTALSLLNTKSQDTDKRLASLTELVGRFRFNGDVRIRYENILQDCDDCLERNRARIRVRFGFDGKLNEDFTAGVVLASGSLGDSNSTNETMTNFFDRQTIAIDKAYITYQPLAHRWLSLTGGKFGFTWQRTPLTFDSDINPEGFTEKFSFDLPNKVFKNFTAQGIQLLYSENNSGTLNTGHDAFAVGGQISGVVQAGFWTATPSFTVLNWRNVNAILNASGFAVAASPGEGPGCAPGTGLPTAAPCVYSPQGFTNATFTDTNDKLQYLSGFLYTDLILNNTFKTPWKKLPFNLLAEYIDNVNAAQHPINPDGDRLNDLGSQSKAYGFDFSVGQIKNKNDIQVGYSWYRIEQDAVLSSWVESEQRAPTNVLQNRIYALWKVRSNTVAAFSYWIGRTLNSDLQHAILAPGVSPGEQEPYLKRLQLDMIYTF